MIKCDCGSERFTAAVILYLDGNIKKIKLTSEDKYESTMFYADTLMEEEFKFDEETPIIHQKLQVKCVECGKAHKIDGWDRIMM